MFAIREKYGDRRWLSKYTEDVYNILHCNMASWTTDHSHVMEFDSSPDIMKVLGNTWYEVKELWSDGQIAALNKFQKDGNFHPFTCNNRNDGNHPLEDEYGDHGVLRARKTGWYCNFCDYTQDWAHEFMFNPTPQF